ncbi:hypothetical protein J7M22_17920 [Candidatus Poribacteria bacterium]|nr:hypothetical protein [Candidatus Poribacteria bacterium]
MRRRHLIAVSISIFVLVMIAVYLVISPKPSESRREKVERFLIEAFLSDISGEVEKAIEGFLMRQEKGEEIPKAGEYDYSEYDRTVSPMHIFQVSKWQSVDIPLDLLGITLPVRYDKKRRIVEVLEPIPRSKERRMRLAELEYEAAIHPERAKELSVEHQIILANSQIVIPPGYEPYAIEGRPFRRLEDGTLLQWRRLPNGQLVRIVRKRGGEILVFPVATLPRRR